MGTSFQLNLRPKLLLARMQTNNSSLHCWSDHFTHQQRAANPRLWVSVSCAPPPNGRNNKRDRGFFFVRCFFVASIFLWLIVCCFETALCVLLLSISQVLICVDGARNRWLLYISCSLGHHHLVACRARIFFGAGDSCSDRLVHVIVDFWKGSPGRSCFGNPLLAMHCVHNNALCKLYRGVLR